MFPLPQGDSNTMPKLRRLLGIVLIWSPWFRSRSFLDRKTNGVIQFRAPLILSSKPRPQRKVCRFRSFRRHQKGDRFSYIQDLVHVTVHTTIICRNLKFQNFPRGTKRIQCWLIETNSAMVCDCVRGQRGADKPFLGLGVRTVAQQLKKQ